MNRLTIKVSILLLLTIGALETGCFQSSNPKDSSGSNWLKCQVLDDCSERSAAVACRDGYCVDSEGERIAVDKDPVDAGSNESEDSRDSSVATEFIGLFHFADDPSNVSNLRIDSDGTFVWGIYGCDFFGGDVGEWKTEGDRLILYPREGVDSFDWTFIGFVTEVEQLTAVTTEYGLQIRSESPNAQEQRWEEGGLCPDCSSVDGSGVRGPTGSPYACNNPYLWEKPTVGETDAGISPIPGGDGGTVVEPPDANSGRRLEFSSITLTRVGTCISQDQVLSATIEYDPEKTEVVLTAEVLRGWLQSECDIPEDCTIRESIGPFVLTDKQISQLDGSFSAIPTGDCFVDLTEVCDISACLFVDLSVDEVPMYTTCSSTECSGYMTAVQRVIALIDRLANPESIVPNAVDCYSPYQNLELAYESEAVGCTCDIPGQSICIGSAALFCEYETGGYAQWISGEDGPCMINCSEDEVVEDDPQTCLGNWMTCVELQDGGFSNCPYDGAL